MDDLADFDRDSLLYSLIAAGQWALFAPHPDRNERVMDVMEFVRELNTGRFDAAQTGYARLYAEFLNLQTQK